MPDLIHVHYASTGESTSTNAMGMREMQERAYAARAAQYLLLKAPPASGKSRALMFIALDKLHYQGLKKAIIAVPERSIGGSFDSTPLSKHGFFSDWMVPPQHNLCTPGGAPPSLSRFHLSSKHPKAILRHWPGGTLSRCAIRGKACKEIQDSGNSGLSFARPTGWNASASG